MYENNYLASRLRAASVGREQAPFLDDHGTEKVVTYGAFFANAEKMAAALVDLGVKPGDRVAVQAPKTIAMLELYIATVLIGGVFLPLNTAYTASEVRYFLDDARPTVLVCEPAKEQSLAEIAADCGVATVLSLDQQESGTLVAQRNAHQPGFKAMPRDADDLAAILYTSGTTGRSKGAMLTHRALASNAETLRQYWRFDAKDILIHALPIFHTHGLFVATNVALIAGCSCIFMAKFDALAICASMRRATVLMGVPTFYVRLLENPGLADAAQNMRLFVSGSAPLLADTHDRWRKTTGHAILERYGMTETNMNTSNPYDGERRAGTVGFPLPGIKVIVTEPEIGKELATGETGVLEVRGPNVFAGYWRMPEKTKEELRDNGFFITGDLGLIDEDGYVHIVGRGKDMIITGGFNVYPKEAELLVDAVEGVDESAVIGVPHADFGEAVVAVVVADKNAQLGETEILSAIADDLARFKQPKRVIIVDALPRNTMGKVQKNVLRETYSKLFA